MRNPDPAASPFRALGRGSARRRNVMLVAVVVAGLAVDAYTHLSLAGTYDAVRGTVSQGQLFRVEAAAAVVAALLLLLRPGRRTAAIAALVTFGGLVALLLYLYVDVGPVGPFPDMYEPFWYAEKTWTVIAEGVATVAAVLIVWTGDRAARGSSRE
jgi:hypothetical protein